MTSAFTVRPDAAFRGQRDYYHSTDLYDTLVMALREHGITATGFELKIHERIVTRPRIDFDFGEPAPETGERPAAFARFETPAGPCFARVYAGPEPIVARNAYDESPIWTRTRREGKAFIVEQPTGAAPIEVVTAVAVRAHKELLPPPAGSRWLLAQLSASRLLVPADADHFRFELVRQVGKGMTQSTMAGLQGVFGKMLFLLK